MGFVGLFSCFEVEMAWPHVYVELILLYESIYQILPLKDLGIIQIHVLTQHYTA